MSDRIPLATGVVLGVPLDEAFNFGPVNLDIDGDGDGIAIGEIFATANGASFSVLAQSPAGINRIGSESQLVQWQTFRKESEDATFEYTITAADLAVFDGSGDNLLICEEDDFDAAVICDRFLLAFVEHSVEIYQADDLYLNNHWIHSSTETAVVTGWANHWVFDEYCFYRIVKKRTLTRLLRSNSRNDQPQPMSSR